MVRKFRDSMVIAVCVGITFFLLSGAYGATSHSDVAALHGIKFSFGSPAQLSSWTGSDPCAGEWVGVTCDDSAPEQRVVGILLSRSGLTGGIPNDIGQLSNLNFLDLSENNLGGQLPPSLGNLRTLSALNLACCGLVGEIPLEYSNLTSLEALWLNDNHFAEPWPTFLSFLPLLDDLNLSNNTPLPHLALAGKLDSTADTAHGRQLQDILVAQAAISPTPAVSPGASAAAPVAGSTSPPATPASAPSATTPTSPSSVPPPVIPAAPAPASVPPLVIPAASPASVPNPSHVSTAPPPEATHSPAALPASPPTSSAPAAPPTNPFPPGVPSPAPSSRPVNSTGSPAVTPVLAPTPSSTGGALPSPSTLPATPPSTTSPAASPVATPSAPGPSSGPRSPSATPTPAVPSPAPRLGPAASPTATPPTSNPTASPPTAFAPTPTLPANAPPAPTPKAAAPSPVTIDQGPLAATAPSPATAPPPTTAPSPVTAAPLASIPGAATPPTTAPPPATTPPPPTAPPPATAPAPNFTPLAPFPPLASVPPPDSNAPPPPSTPGSPASQCANCSDPKQIPRGNGDCTCVYPILFTLVFQRDYSLFTPSVQEELKVNVANRLSVPKDQILLLSSRSGSIIASMAMVPAAPDTSLSQVATTSASDILTTSNNIVIAPSLGATTVQQVTVPTISSPPASPPPQVSPSPPPPPPPASGTPSKKKKSSLSTAAIIGIAVGAGVLILAILVCLCLLCCRGKSKKGYNNSADLENKYEPPESVEAEPMYETPAPLPPVVSHQPPPPGPSLRDDSPRSGVPLLSAEEAAVGAAIMKRPATRVPAFTVAELQEATESFAADNKIGEGALGVMYHAALPDGRELAVKKMDASVVEGQSDDDFVAIVANMARLKHPNVVPVEGYCIQHRQRLIAFQYYPHGTLFENLHPSNPVGELLWDTRIAIAIGCARALAYLHEDCSPPVIHRNFKSGNVLLDSQLGPHVADAGLSVFAPFGFDGSEDSTHNLEGLTYRAPEYTMSGIYTAKSDVYSFGVVLLELLTGRPPLDSQRPKTEQLLVKWAAPLLHDGDALAAMVDPSLRDRPDRLVLQRFADVITRCIQPEPEYRPAMSRVVQDLIKRVQKAQVNRRATSNEGINLE